MSDDKEVKSVEIEIEEKKEAVLETAPETVPSIGEKRKNEEAKSATADQDKKKKKKKSRHSRYDTLDEPKTDSDDSDDGNDDIDDEKLIVEDEEEDDLAEIDATNIITQGRRTRGKVIDYSKIQAEMDKEQSKGKVDEDEDEEEDDDFKEKEEKK